MRIHAKAFEFEWDQGNKNKNLVRHRVTDEECEEVFFDPQKKATKDVTHSQSEPRYILLGKTRKERILFIVFTTRKDKIRIISARDINKKERVLYY